MAPAINPSLFVLASDAAKSLLPFQRYLRRIKRRITSYTDNPANSDLAVMQGLDQIAMLRLAGIDLHGDVLEFGSGWLPIIPILLHIAGARSLLLTDVEKLMDEKTIGLAKRAIAARAQAVATGLNITKDELCSKLQEPFTLTYLVPWNPLRTPSASIDIIVSRTVFEHVPEADLRRLLFQFARIIRPDGAMCHIIDNSDHWQHRDKRLSRLNFLRYGKRSPIWRISCMNVQNFQNRLRHADYAELFKQTGWNVVAEDGDVDKQSLRDAKSIPLAPQFRGRDPCDLATLTSRFVLRATR